MRPRTRRSSLSRLPVALPRPARIADEDVHVFRLRHPRRMGANRQAPVGVPRTPRCRHEHSRKPGEGGKSVLSGSPSTDVRRRRRWSERSRPPRKRPRVRARSVALAEDRGGAPTCLACFSALAAVTVATRPVPRRVVRVRLVSARDPRTTNASSCARVTSFP